ncbi:hypothetical protein FOMPIDRAFT_86909 [Fomitopsis schrenkii]|uniref:HMG box domain-containing protein n=1 Tax=Fomitopsis schrenkii TaxID=2126942 RepID=S8EF40_FOMSC|nr:hypothetical protein FOMPIDRAFT_86909 [Fomitopsis schrenkii]
MVAKLIVVHEGDSSYPTPLESQYFFPAPTVNYSTAEFMATLDNASTSNAGDSTPYTYAEHTSSAYDEYVPAQPFKPQAPPSPPTRHSYLGPEALASLSKIGITAAQWELILSDAEQFARETIQYGGLPPTRTSTRTRRAEATNRRKGPRRPLNCYLTFRKGVHESGHFPQAAKSRQKDLSSALGMVWNALPDRRLFKQAADVLKEEHERDNPGYMYQPERKAGKKQSKRRREETDDVEEAKENKRPRSEPIAPSTAGPSRRSRKGKEKALSIEPEHELEVATPLAPHSPPSPVSRSPASSPSHPPMIVPPSLPPPPMIVPSSLPQPPTITPPSLPPPPTVAPVPTVAPALNSVPHSYPPTRYRAYSTVLWLPEADSEDANWLLNAFTAWYRSCPVPLSETLQPLPVLTENPSAPHMEPSEPTPQLSAEAIALAPPSSVQAFDQFELGPTDWDNPGPFPEPSIVEWID